MVFPVLLYIFGFCCCCKYLSFIIFIIFKYRYVGMQYMLRFLNKLSIYDWTWFVCFVAGGADGSPYGMHPRMIMVPPPPPPLSSSQYQISGGGFTPMGGLGVGGGPPPPHQQMGGAQMPPPPPNFASTESLNTKNHPHHHHQFQL